MAVAREARIEFILAVGGGSVIDGTKFIAAEAIHGIVAALEAHGMTRLGEGKDITPEVSRRILQRAL